MFNSSSKMPVPRSKFGVFAAVLGLGLTARAQTAPPPVAWANTDGPRIGELAPQFAMPDFQSKPFDSRSLLGQKPLYLVLDGPTPLIQWNSNLGMAAKKADGRGIALVMAAPNPLIGKEHSWEAPFNSLRVPDGSLKDVPAPTFLAIDRAGWLRDIEKLPTKQTDPANVQLQFLLSQPDPTPPLQVGAVAPDFSFRDADGSWRRVSALRGRKNLLLTFFPKCFTGKCRTHLSSLRDNFPAFIASNTEVWAVSVDPAEGDSGQLAFSRELNLPFPMLPDVGRNICLLYDAASSTTELAQRQSVLIDKNGVVRWMTKNVNPETHGEDVMAKIVEFGLEK